MSKLAGSTTGGGHGESGLRNEAFDTAQSSSPLAGSAGLAARLAVGADERAWRPAPWKTHPMSFGQRLKAQRERRGVPLEVIAEAYKINRSLLADLERDDLSKWPRGVFGRGFVRAYATAIGLAPGPILAEFVSLCPDDGDGTDAPAHPGGDNDLRLVLAGDGRAALASAASRAYAAALEAGLILAAGYAVSTMTSQSVWSLASAIAMVYYPCAAAFLGRSPSEWWLERHRLRGLRNADARADRPRRPLHLIVSRTDRPEPDAPSPTLKGA